MDHPERYDPEDIESLLRERAYDELLVEERAFVLRHLSGREEYEHMRALLQDLRDADHDRTPIEADPRVRQEVLGVFRQQQVPFWRIWLNTLGGLVPNWERSSGFRPALAIATVLLLVGGGVMVLRYVNFGADPTELAEIRPLKDAEERSVPPAEPAGTVQRPLDSDKDILLNEREANARSIVTTGSTEIVLHQDELRDQEMSREDLMEEAFVVASGAQRGSTTTDVELDADDAAMDVARTESIAAASSPYSRVVSAKELMQNQSLADVDAVAGEIRTEKPARSTGEPKGRSLADDAPLIDLLVAGW